MSIIDDLKKSQTGLHGAIDGLSIQELTRPNTMGEWSIRDVVLHLAMWEGEVLKALSIWRSGQKVDWAYVKDHKGILRFNDFWISSMKHLSAKKVISIFDEIHVALIADVSAITDAKGGRRRPLPKWLREITVGHNSTHIKKILSYRRKSGI